MGRAVHVEPLVGGALVGADLLAHAGGEDLGPAARQRVQPGLAQPGQHLRHGHAVVLVVIEDLHRGEGLEVDAGLDALQAAQQLGVVVEGQPVVQPVDDVDLGHRLAGVDPGLQAAPGLLERHGVGAGVALLEAGERAEHAAGHADVGGVDVEVAVEVGAVAVQPLAHAVGQRRHLQQVGVVEQRHPVVQRQRLAGSRPCPGSRPSGLIRAPPRGGHRTARSQGCRPAPRSSVAASLRVMTGLCGVGAQPQRPLGQDRAEQLVGPEAEAHLGQPVPQPLEVGHHVRDGQLAAGRAPRGAGCRGPSARPRGVGITPVTGRPSRSSAASSARRRAARRPRAHRRGRAGGGTRAGPAAAASCAAVGAGGDQQPGAGLAGPPRRPPSAADPPPRRRTGRRRAAPSRRRWPRSCRLREKTPRPPRASRAAAAAARPRANRSAAGPPASVWLGEAATETWGAWAWIMTVRPSPQRGMSWLAIPS